MPYSIFPLRKNERIFLQIQHFMREYSVFAHISWGNPLRFLYPIEKAQLLQAALDHSVFRFHAYFFLCSITPASSAKSICASSCASPSNAVCCGSPSRILSVLRISLGITTRPNSSDCVNQVQKIFVKPRKALKYKDSSAFGAFTPVLLIESF